MSRYILPIRRFVSAYLLAHSVLPVAAQDAGPALQYQEAPPAPPNAVVQGTIALIQLTDRIDTRTVKAGDHFHARLAEPLTAEDGESLPEGAKIKGHVSSVLPGFRTRIILSFDQIETRRDGARSSPQSRAFPVNTVCGPSEKKEKSDARA